MDLHLLGSIDAKDEPFAFGTQNHWFAMWRGGGLFRSSKVAFYNLAGTQPIRSVNQSSYSSPGNASTTTSVGYLAVDASATRIAVCYKGSASFAVPGFTFNVGLYDFASDRFVPCGGLSTRLPGPVGTLVAALSPGGHMLAAPSWHGNVLHLLDVDSAFDKNRKGDVPLVTLESGPRSRSYGIAWSPDGKLLAHFCDADPSPVLDLWRLPNGDDPDLMQAESIGTARLEGKAGVSMSKPRAGLAFSPDSDLVAVGGLKKPYVFRLYSVSRGEFVADSVPLQGEVSKLVFSPDGLHVFSGDVHGSIVVWRLDGIDRPSLVMSDSASVEGAVIGLDVDREMQSLCIASASNRTVSLHAAALPGS